MSKKKPQHDPTLKQAKLKTEALKKKLSESIIDNPKFAKKAAIILTNWIEGKKKEKKEAA